VLNGLDQNYVELVIGLIKERADLVPDLWRLGKYFFEAPDRYDEKSLKKAWREDTNVLLTELVSVLENANDGSAKSIKIAVSDWIKSKNIGFGKIMMPLRVALVGALEGVDVFEIVFYIGKKETIGRINALIQHNSKVVIRFKVKILNNFNLMVFKSGNSSKFKTNYLINKFNKPS